jgi:5'-nucleotidase
MTDSSQPRRSRRVSAALAAALTVTLAGTAVAADAKPEMPTRPAKGVVPVQLLAFNDFHGHLETSTPGNIEGQPAGGSEYLATHLEELRAGHGRTLTVAAGDLIGGSPFLSGLFHDEPSVESLNAIGLDVSGVGNHEFDEGVDELLRMQNGGCHPVDGCYFEDAPYPGADFDWLAANVTNDDTGKTVLPPTWVKTFGETRIGFIGMTLEGTDALVAQSGIRGWSFQDEVETANALVPELRGEGVETIVVLLHEGGLQSGGYNECVGMSGPIMEIAQNLDPAIDAVITGHTHQAYNCQIPDPAGEPRSVTSAASNGRIVTELTLPVERATGDVRRQAVTATNHVVTRDVEPAADQTEIIEKWSALADVVGNTVVGQVTTDIRRAYESETTDDRGKESDMGNLIADAQLWATQGNDAQIALMNPGGLRADLLYESSDKGEGDGMVTYAEAFAVQPFGNLLSTIPMTGEQIRTALEQQCQTSRQFQLGVSAGFTYTDTRTISSENPRTCLSIEVSDMKLGDKPIDLDATYKVTVNNFIADGGDNFTVFEEIDPSLRVGGGEDLDALIGYLGENSPIAPPGTNRVDEQRTVVNPSP